MNLVITAAGVDSLHRNYIPTKEDNYQLVIICYTKEAYTKFKEDKGCKVIFKKGYKFNLIHDYLKELKHDYYLFLDDDIYTTNKDINTLFKTSSMYRTMISHLSMGADNQTHNIICQDKNTEVRFTNWIELQAICFERGTLNELKYTFIENKSGQGLPELWNSIIKNTNRKFAIIDTAFGIHTKKMTHSEERVKEYVDLKEKYNLPPLEILTLGRVYRNQLSVCIIYDESDEMKLPECVNSLPAESEIVLVKTIPTKEKTELKNIINNPNRIYAEYFYHVDDLENYQYEFNFGEARNIARGLATKEWILSIDADERLAPHEHITITRALEQAGDEVGGFISANVSHLSYVWSKGEPISKLNKQVRLSRNLKQIRWTGAIHESLEDKIVAAGLKLKYIMITILHGGYNIGGDDFMKKLERNVQIGLRHSDDLLKSPHRLQQFLNDARALAETREQLNKEIK